VSNSIKELLNWQLIHRVPMLGDRRDHYAAETDIWEMVTRIARGRKAREVDPAEAALKAATAEADADKAVSAVARERLHAMLEFVTTMSRWHDEMLRLPKSTLLTFIKMGSKVTRFLGK
jgi:DNA-binding transcriptional regulator GbsR (MarR family)